MIEAIKYWWRFRYIIVRYSRLLIFNNREVYEHGRVVLIDPKLLKYIYFTHKVMKHLPKRLINRGY